MNVILKWDKTERTNMMYNSFKCFIPLLNCFESSAVQLYAVWSLNYFYSKDRKKTTHK
jgi:hypothetical protein